MDLVELTVSRIQQSLQFQRFLRIWLIDGFNKMNRFTFYRFEISDTVLEVDGGYTQYYQVIDYEVFELQ